MKKKEGRLKRNKDVLLIDLPGIYSLSPYTPEEVITRKVLLQDRPDAIINIVDGTNLERNLYLTTQLRELGIPVLVAINMMDVVDKGGDSIDLDGLSKKLGCEVVAVSALKGIGVDQVAQKAMDLAKNTAAVGFPRLYSSSVEAALERVQKMIGEDIHAEHKRFFAVKLFERDGKIGELMKTPPDVEAVIVAAETEHDDDAESIITNERYLFISAVVAACSTKKNRGALTRSDKIDRVVTNRWLALPIFMLVMFAVYYISVTTVGGWATDWANDGVFGEGWNFFGAAVPGLPVLAESVLTALGTADWLNGLIIDGIIGGVGAVLGFVPQMFILFLFLAILEACGYMARVAFIMDRVFRKFGLSGKSFIPMLIGTGCSIPGIMASRTIENERDRRMTVITTSFMPCGAKLPIIALISGALFGGAWWVAPSAYFVGIAAIIASGIILKKARMFAGDPSPFVMELPAYHRPTVGIVLRSMWERGWSFVKKAGTIILLSAVVLWFLMSFGFSDGRFGMVEELNNGLLSKIGGAIAPVFSPLGWGSWQAAVATITGLIAKENVVGTFGILYGFAEVAEDGEEIWGTLAAAFSTLSAYSFLVFNLLCAPCFAAIGAIRREMNNPKWTAFAVAYQTVFAYACALIVYQIGNLIVSGMFGVGTLAGFMALAGLLYVLLRPTQKQKIRLKKEASKAA